MRLAEQTIGAKNGLPEQLVEKRIGTTEQPGPGRTGEEVRREDAMVVGSIALMNVGHGTGVIRKMFVKREFRGKELSIAQRLLDTLVAHCRGNGISDLYLGTVGQMKAAHRFYERNGFRPIEMDALPSWFPRMPTDHLFYHLHL
ncbi:MAG: GNAT family N-acetyltransferase [Bacteroidetes bacterium]|nr:GNAT family N-acetyltransferase [Bacteroidota bacterium]